MLETKGEGGGSFQLRRQHPAKKVGTEGGRGDIAKNSQIGGNSKLTFSPCQREEETS